MQLVYIINILSLLVICVTCLFLCLSPSIKIAKPIEFMLWGMIFVCVGLIIDGADSQLNVNATVSFRGFLAVFIVLYARHKYKTSRMLRFH